MGVAGTLAAVALVGGSLSGAAVAWAARHDIPQDAAAAYLAAASSAPAGCNITPAQIAGVASIETHHGTYVGAGRDGRIIGPPLDGSDGVMLIWDTDGGRLDDDPTYDRAVGPFQFIPDTARAMGLDDPHDLGQAAAAAARYLCLSGDLSNPDNWRDALLRYNHSTAYFRDVDGEAQRFADGAPTGADAVAAAPTGTGSTPTTGTGGGAAKAGEIADRAAARVVDGWDRLGRIVDRPDTPTLRNVWSAADRAITPLVRADPEQPGVDPAPGAGQPAADAAKPTGGYCSPEGEAGLEASFRKALNDLSTASARAGHGPITITSGCRTAETQAWLWADALSRYGDASIARQWVAPAGCDPSGCWSNSNHSTGAAADLGFADDEAMVWVHANGPRLGVCFPLWDGARGTNEWWHAEPCEL